MPEWSSYALPGRMNGSLKFTDSKLTSPQIRLNENPNGIWKNGQGSHYWGDDIFRQSGSFGDGSGPY